MTLNYPSYFMIIIVWWRGIFFFWRWLENYSTSIWSNGKASLMWLWKRGFTSWLTSTFFRSLFTGSIVYYAVNFIFSKEKDIFIILFQNNLKHILKEMFILSFVILVLNFIKLNYFYCIERNCWNWPCQITNWMIVIFIVSKWSSRKLYPSINKILFNTWLKL